MKFINKIKNKKAKLCGVGVSTAAVACMPAMSAFAATGAEMFGDVKNYLSGGVGALGVILIDFGLINLGLTIKDGMQGGGGQLAGAIAMIVGGAIVCAAALLFGSVDTGWMS